MNILKYLRLNVALQVVGVLLVVAAFMGRAHWIAGPVFWVGVLLVIVGFVWSSLVTEKLDPPKA